MCLKKVFLSSKCSLPFLPATSPLPSLLSSVFGVESQTLSQQLCWAVVVTSQSLSGGVIWWLPPPAAASGPVLWAE